MSKVTSVQGMKTLQGLQAFNTGLQLASVAKLEQLQESSEILIEQNNKLISSMNEIGAKISTTNALLKDGLEIQRAKEQRDLIEIKIVDFIFELSKSLRNLKNRGSTDFEKKVCADLFLLHMHANEITTKNIHTFRNKELLQENLDELEEFSKLKLSKEDEHHLESFQRYEELEMLNNLLTLNIESIAETYPTVRIIKRLKKKQKESTKKINELELEIKTKTSRLEEQGGQLYEGGCTGALIGSFAWSGAIIGIAFFISAISQDQELNKGIISENPEYWVTYFILSIAWVGYFRVERRKAKYDRNLLITAEKDLKKLLTAFEINQKTFESYENMNYISNEIKPNITRLFSGDEYKEFSDEQLFSNNLINSNGHSIIKKSLHSSYKCLSKFKQLYELIKKSEA